MILPKLDLNHFFEPAPNGVGEKNKEQPIGQFIPYTVHYDDSTLLTEHNQLIKIIKLEGLSFQTRDEEELRRHKVFRNRLARSISKSDYGVYIHIVRRKHFQYPDGVFPNQFCTDFDAAWHAKHQQNEHYINELYLSICKLPFKTGVVTGAKDRIAYWSHKGNQEKLDQWRKRCAQDLNDTTGRILQTLGTYSPRLLKIYEKEDGHYSQPLRFLKYLTDWKDREVRVPRMSIKEYLASNRPIFGTEAMEMRGIAQSQLGAFLSIKEYPDQTDQGMLDKFLNLPVEMVITQSFHFEDRRTAGKKIEEHQNQLNNADDKAKSQIADLDFAQDDLASGDTATGWHHLTVLVKAADNRLETLDRALVSVEDAFVDLNIEAVRETLNLEACFWAQLPGNFDFIARKRRITTLNLAGFASLHNHPTGKLDGNWWGSPIMVLETESRTAYNLNFHLGSGPYPPGHVHVAAPTGTGKSTLINSALAQAQRVDPVIFYFDKDHGGEIFAAACGADRTSIVTGKPSGWNPLQLPDTKENRSFLSGFYDLLLTANGESLSAEDRNVIANAVEGGYRLDQRDRNLYECARFFGIGKENSLRNRLDMWLPGGQYAGLFDNETDEFKLDGRFSYFDMTRIIKDKIALPAVLAYIFHRIDLVMNGQPFIIVLEEGWNLRKVPYFRDRIDDWLMTVRKKNGVVIFITPDLSLSYDEKSDSLVKQPVTFLYFSNDKAGKEAYCKKFNLSEKEFEIVRESDKNDFLVLLKQGSDSVVLRTALDTPELRRFLPVLSGNEGNVNLMHQIMDEVNSQDPEIWLPIFLNRAT